MRRAVLTATPIAAACGLPLRLEPALHERRVGALAGTSTHNGDLWPRTLERWLAGETGYAPDGAESFDAIRDRVRPVWDRLTVEYAGRTFVIVAHGMVCKVLLLTLLPEWSVGDWKRFGPVPNVGISELLGGPDGWRAVRLNEVVPAVAAVNGLAVPAPTGVRLA
jgi:broad specificity phosphatase PhoE